MKKKSLWIIMVIGLQMIVWMPQVMAISGEVSLIPADQLGTTSITIPFFDCKENDQISIKATSKNGQPFIIIAGALNEMNNYSSPHLKIYGNQTGVNLMGFNQKLTATQGDFAVVLLAKNSTVTIEYTITKVTFPWYLIGIIAICVIGMTTLIVRKKGKKNKTSEMAQTTKIN